jgi:hypothetical protein
MFFQLKMTNSSNRMRDVRPGPVTKFWTAFAQSTRYATYPAAPMEAAGMIPASRVNLLIEDAILDTDNGSSKAEHPR